MFGIEVTPLTWAAFGGAAVIFGLRVVGVTLATVRVLVMMRGQKLASVVMGFFEVLVYVIAIGQVVDDLSNIWNILGYCFGFSAGTLVGMWLDDRLITGYATVNVTSAALGRKIAQAIRDAGYGATVGWGMGRNGRVYLVSATVRRKEINEVVKLAEGIDKSAFVTVEETRAIRRGYLHVTRLEK